MKTSLKCGYIVLIDNKQFVIYCALCGSRYLVPGDYFSHVLDFHNLKEISESDPTEVRKYMHIHCRHILKLHFSLFRKIFPLRHHLQYLEIKKVSVTRKRVNRMLQVFQVRKTLLLLVAFPMK